MSIFGAIGIASTGLTANQKWLDAISDNLANQDNATSTSAAAFQAKYVIAQANSDGGGVSVVGVALGSAEGRIVNEPNNPLADAAGNVRYPMAQRGYQANAAVVDRARETYEAALQIGRS